MDDETAIRNCQNGDIDEFRHLVERYQKQAVSQAIAILRNHQDALDAVQDAFVDAFRSLEKFDSSRRFYPWFYVLLRNRCFKTATRRRETQNVEDVGVFEPQTRDSNDERLALESALKQLAGEDREILILKYVEGLSYDQLAEQLQIPKGTVMSRLFHARKKLQTELTASV